jgi:DNA mismatch repair protein MSH5
VEESGGVFQIRPRKDFITAKGRDRILSLSLLSNLPSEENEPHSGIDTVSESKNAYEFMRRRRDEVGDPTTKRWNAAIRLSNFASAESSPLCVCDLTARLPLGSSDLFRSLLSEHCLTS